MIDKKKKKMSKKEFLIQMLLVSVVPIALLSVFLSFTAHGIMKKNIQNEMNGELKSAAETIRKVVEAGEAAGCDVTGYGIFLGDHRIQFERSATTENDQSVVGIEISIFKGPKRVETTLQNKMGTELLGTVMDRDIEETVLVKGASCYKEDVVVNGKKYYAYYQPLHDTSGEIIGAIAVGKNAEEIEDYVTYGLNNLILGCTILIGIVFILVSVRVSQLVSYTYELISEEEKMASIERANKSKTAFLANMSHEIRTPINAVLGMDEMILRENSNKEIEKYALNIQNAGRSLLAIINDILDFSKIEAGNMSIIEEPYELTSLLNDCYTMVIRRADEKGLKVNFRNNPAMPYKLIGDETRIRQCFLNILTNAVKYTRIGEINVDVEWEALGGNNMYLDISVNDTGIGIKDEDLPKLFDKFERVDESKNRNIEGTGLGLAITKKMIELMNGQLLVESTYGVGSTFTMRVKQKIAEITPMGKYEIRNQKVDKYTYKESFVAPNAKILVVDDSAVNLEVTKGLLKETKIGIDTVLSGNDCLELCQMTKYDLIFMDHMMPGMDGIQTFKKLKEIENGLNAETPVIILTANAISGAKEQYLSKGFDGYLSKPIRIDALEQTLIEKLPKEKVIIEKKSTEENSSTEDQGKNTENEKKSLIASLTFLNTELGSSYCGTEELYKEILTTYVESDKSTEIQKDFEDKNWDEYRILVHGVKSTSLYIGAKELSEKMKALEMAAKEENADYIMTNHEKALNDYKDMIVKIREVLNI